MNRKVKPHKQVKSFSSEFRIDQNKTLSLFRLVINSRLPCKELLQKFKDFYEIFRTVFFADEIQQFLNWKQLQVFSNTFAYFVYQGWTNLFLHAKFSGHAIFLAGAIRITKKLGLQNQSARSNKRQLKELLFVLYYTNRTCSFRF